MLNDSGQCELEKADSLRDNMSSLMLPNGRPKCPYSTVQYNQWMAISALCSENGRWPTVIMHTGYVVRTSHVQTSAYSLCHLSPSSSPNGCSVSQFRGLQVQLTPVSG